MLPMCLHRKIHARVMSVTDELSCDQGQLMAHHHGRQPCMLTDTQLSGAYVQLACLETATEALHNVGSW